MARSNSNRSGRLDIDREINRLFEHTELEVGRSLRHYADGERDYEVLSQSEINRRYNDLRDADENIFGVYDKGLKTKYVVEENRTDADIAYTLAHEIGHEVYNRIERDIDRDTEEDIIVGLTRKVLKSLRENYSDDVVRELAGRAYDSYERDVPARKRRRSTLEARAQNGQGPPERTRAWDIICDLGGGILIPVRDFLGNYAGPASVDVYNRVGGVIRNTGNYIARQWNQNQAQGQGQGQNQGN